MNDPIVPGSVCFVNNFSIWPTRNPPKAGYITQHQWVPAKYLQDALQVSCPALKRDSHDQEVARWPRVSPRWKNESYVSSLPESGRVPEAVPVLSEYP